MTMPPGHESPYPGSCADRLTRVEERLIALKAQHVSDLAASWRALSEVTTEARRALDEARAASSQYATRESVEAVDRAVRDALQQAQQSTRDALAAANTLTEARAAANHAAIERLEQKDVARDAADLERGRIARQTRWMVMALLAAIPIGYSIVIGILETTH
jgi:hypothetical protein